MDILKLCLPRDGRALLAAVPLLLAVPLAQAQTPAEAVPTYTVSYDPSSLSTKQGQEALERRINAAARKVCGDAWDLSFRDLHLMSEYRRCVHDAADRALADVHARITLASDAQAGGR